MIQFERLEKDRLKEVAHYFSSQKLHVSDYSVGFQFMWGEYMQSEFAIVANCLVLKEVYDGDTYFHYPISLTGSCEEECEAIALLEKDCRDGCFRLHFTNVPRSRLGDLVLRYGVDVSVSNARCWRDYLYRVKDFCSYAGGRYSGQRNHVNKFKKNYPDWSFRPYTFADERRVVDFLTEYGALQSQKNSAIADEELNNTYDLLSCVEPLGLSAWLLFVGERLVAFTVGERCGDMVVVHIEKALREYEGVYPFVAQQFALNAQKEGVEYLNRMDDAGDLGLRKSKLQYLPCELVDKYNVIPHREIERIKEKPMLKTSRLTIAPIEQEDKEEYARLASDEIRNRYWGYDYRVDYKGETPPPSAWFLCLAEWEFREGNELSEGIYLNGKLIGEVVLHRFGYARQVEIGARLLPEYEGRGYAREAIHAFANYAFAELGMERVEAKCFRENERSKRMLISAGFRPNGEDDTYFYFYKTPAV